MHRASPTWGVLCGAVPGLLLTSTPPPCYPPPPLHLPLSLPRQATLRVQQGLAGRPPPGGTCRGGGQHPEWGLKSPLSGDMGERRVRPRRAAAAAVPRPAPAWGAPGTPEDVARSLCTTTPPPGGVSHSRGGAWAPPKQSPPRATPGWPTPPPSQAVKTQAVLDCPLLTPQQQPPPGVPACSGTLTSQALASLLLLDSSSPQGPGVIRASGTCGSPTDAAGQLRLPAWQGQLPPRAGSVQGSVPRAPLRQAFPPPCRLAGSFREASSRLSWRPFDSDCRSDTGPPPLETAWSQLSEVQDLRGGPRLPRCGHPG